MDDILQQHQNIWTDDNIVLECLYTGNVSEKEATTFFEKANGIIERARMKATEETRYVSAEKSTSLVPGEWTSCCMN
jgi:hypothetical protein